MAGAVTASPYIILTSANSLPSTTLSPSSHHHFSFFSKALQQQYRWSPRRSRLSKFCSLRSGKLNPNGVDEPDDTDEVYYEDDEVMMEDETDEDDAESSVDLLLRFAYSMFRKVSRRARKASRLILPDVISPQLVAFAVDGLLLLASLTILKALLEVVCTLGGTVFVVILLLRVLWAAVSYFQSTGNNFNQNGTSYRTRPVT